MKTKLKNYCNKESKLFYKKNKLYKLINKTINNCGIIDYGNEEYEFLGTHTPISYYKGLISNFDPIKFDYTNISNIYLIVFVSMDTSFNELFSLIDKINPKDYVDLKVAFKFMKHVKKNKMVLLNFK